MWRGILVQRERFGGMRPPCRQFAEMWSSMLSGQFRSGNRFRFGGAMRYNYNCQYQCDGCCLKDGEVLGFHGGG